MRRVCGLLGVPLALAGWASLACAGPKPLQGVKVFAVVSADTRTGIFTYRYLVANPPVNNGEIVSVQIDLSRHPGEVALSDKGLVNGPRYMPNTSQNALDHASMVPGGISGPEG